jgi:flagellar hook-length control protein FliK
MSIAKTNYIRQDMREQLQGSRGSQSQKELLTEFSQILERIAVQISSTEEFSALVRDEAPPEPSKRPEAPQKADQKNSEIEEKKAERVVEADRPLAETPSEENVEQVVKSDKKDNAELASSLDDKKEAEVVVPATQQEASRSSKEARNHLSQEDSSKAETDTSKVKKLSKDEIVLLEAEQKAAAALIQSSEASVKAGPAGDRQLVNLFLQALLSGGSSNEQSLSDSTNKSGTEILVSQFMMSQFANIENFSADAGRALTGELRTVMAVDGGSASRQNMGNLKNSAQARMKAGQMSESLASRTLERVEEALREVAKSRDGKTISIRLDPPNLGSVKIDVTLKDGSLHARLMAESVQVSNLLREKAHDLQNMLRKMGLSVDTVSVSVNSDESLGNRDSSFSEHQDKAMSSDIEGKPILKTGSAAVTQSSKNEVLDHWVA